MALAKGATQLTSGLFPLAGLWTTKQIIDSVATGDENTAYLMVALFALFVGLQAVSGRVSVGLAVYMESRIPTHANALLQQKVNSFQTRRYTE